jgi:hypothetical protein
MFKDEIVKVTIGKVSFSGDDGKRGLAVRFDLHVPLDIYRKIDPNLAKMIKAMVATDAESLPQLQWTVEMPPCKMVFAPTRDCFTQLDSETPNFLVDLGEVELGSRLIIVTRKPKGADDPELILLATARLPLNERTVMWAVNHFQIDAWVHIQTPQERTTSQTADVIDHADDTEDNPLDGDILL